jgi:hypothetical protein
MGGLVPISGPFCGGLHPERSSHMRSFAQHLPGDPARRESQRSRCHHDSKREPVPFRPISRTQAVRVYRRARSLDRRTHVKGRHGGRIGPTALAVLEVMIFGFLNWRTGRLDPSHDAIAAKAGVCSRSVRTALARLREAGVLNWLRRCHDAWSQDGRWTLIQDTNAYTVNDPDQWDVDGRPIAPPRPPHRDTWAAPTMPDTIENALIERRTTGDIRAMVRELAVDQDSKLAVALASLGRNVLKREDWKADRDRRAMMDAVAIDRELGAKR